jgi:hypothetical protein
MVLHYACFCPRAGDCRKGGKRLATAITEAEARQKIVHHLTTSSYHGLSEDEAVAEAASAELLLEEYAEEPPEPKGKGKKGGGGGWEWREHAWGEGWTEGNKGKGGGKRWEPYPTPVAQQALVPAQPCVQANLDQLQTIMSAASRAESAARTAARMAKAAAAAFDEEAHVLREAVDLLRASTMGLR